MFLCMFFMVAQNHWENIYMKSLSYLITHMNPELDIVSTE